MFVKFKTLNLKEDLQLIYYYYHKKYYEISYYEPNFKLTDNLEEDFKLKSILKFKLFLYKNFTYLIILSKKVRDRLWNTR
mgnify:CR=1 FL=1